MSQPLAQKMGVRHGLESDDHTLNGRKIEVNVNNTPTRKLVPALRDILALVLILCGIIALVTGASVAWGFAIGVMVFGACVGLLGILIALQ